jgi:hypothetical protein
MDRDQLLARLDGAWQEFNQACQGLSEKALQEPGVMGDWSVKDLLSHIATWEEECLAALKLILEVKRPARYASSGGIDAFNHRQWLRYRDWPLGDVQRRFRETHHRLVAFVATVPSHHFTTETRFRRRLRLDTYSHFPEHWRQVAAWRQAKGL